MIGVCEAVQLDKMTKKAEEWARTVEWMGRKDGQLRVQRDMGTSCQPKHRTCSTGMVAREEDCMQLGSCAEAVQERIVRRLLGASITVASWCGSVR